MKGMMSEGKKNGHIPINVLLDIILRPGTFFN
jgi:hypothetical protein